MVDGSEDTSPFRRYQMNLWMKETIAQKFNTNNDKGDVLCFGIHDAHGTDIDILWLGAKKSFIKV